MMTTSIPETADQRADLVNWLCDQLEKAEKTLSARLQMANSWRSGTSKSWKAAGCRLTKSQRLQESAKHERISVKCRRDVEMLRQTLAIVITFAPKS